MVLVLFFVPCHAFNTGSVSHRQYPWSCTSIRFFNFCWQKDALGSRSGNDDVTERPVGSLQSPSRPKTRADVALDLTREKDRNSLSSERVVSWRGHMVYSLKTDFRQNTEIYTLLYSNTWRKFGLFLWISCRLCIVCVRVCACRWSISVCLSERKDRLWEPVNQWVTQFSTLWPLPHPWEYHPDM